MICVRYKKNLKALYVVHPTTFIRVIWNLFRPIIRYRCVIDIASVIPNFSEYDVFW